jgi:hypothetical protein
MQIEELKKMAYMEGFVEDALNEAHKKMTEEGDTKHAEELKSAWLILTVGIAKLRQENQSMQNKLTLIQNGLNT